MSPPRTRKRQKQSELKEKWPLASRPALKRLHAPVGVYLSAPIYYFENDVSKINERVRNSITSNMEGAPSHKSSIPRTLVPGLRDVSF